VIIVQTAPEQKANPIFYRDVLETLRYAEIPFLISGGFALQHFTGISREIRDLDIFVLEKDIHPALQALAAAGYPTELTFSHWLGKVYDHTRTEYVDLIFSSGNGLCKVTQTWFERAVPSEVFDMPVFLCAPEEMIWQKAFIMERERYDGADIAHLIRAQTDTLDWQRLLGLFGRHWRVLLSHLILFEFIYPTERSKIPLWVRQRLLGLLESEFHEPSADEQVCQGPLLSRSQFRVDTEQWGYKDARLTTMSAEEVAQWTEAASQKEEKA
jgi:Uncharacterised nucleotidyltransferase